MAESWVRLWLTMPSDPKWRTIARKSGRPISEVVSVFTYLMADAGGNATQRGVTQCNNEDVASNFDMDEEHVEAIREAMQGRVLDGDRLLGWEKRQPLRNDDSSKRVRALRERRRLEKEAETQGNAAVTHCNAPDSDPDSESKNDPDPPADAGKSGTDENSQSDFYRTRRKRKIRGRCLIQFEQFWQAWSCAKHSKAEAADAWLDIDGNHSATGLEAEFASTIINGARAEASRRADLVRQGATPKWAQGWLSGRRWECDLTDDGTRGPGPTPEDIEQQQSAQRARDRIDAIHARALTHGVHMDYPGGSIDEYERTVDEQIRLKTPGGHSHADARSQPAT